MQNLCPTHDNFVKHDWGRRWGTATQILSGGNVGSTLFFAMRLISIYNQCDIRGLRLSSKHLRKGTKRIGGMDKKTAQVVDACKPKQGRETRRGKPVNCEPDGVQRSSVMRDHTTFPNSCVTADFLLGLWVSVERTNTKTRRHGVSASSHCFKNEIARMNP